MRKNFYDPVDVELNIPEKQRHFPSIYAIDEISQAIEELGFVDTTYGGIGFRGHIAFNEPPLSPWRTVTAEEYKNSKTRILNLNDDTIVALSHRYRGAGSTYEFDGRPLGKGPYSACQCQADARFVERLVDVAHQLRDAAIQEAWSVDWSRFNGHHDRAVAAALAGDYAEAVREHCHAISFMMSELRRQRGRRLSEDWGTRDPLV